MSKQREALKCLYDSISKPPMSPLEQKWAEIIEEALAEPEPWTPDDMAYRPGGLSMNSEMPARKPLTDEEIDNLELPPNGCTMRELVRVVERAHGITE